MQNDTQKGIILLKTQSLHNVVMKIIMKDLSFNSISEVYNFLQGSSGASFEIKTSEDKYKFISENLVKFRYKQLLTSRVIPLQTCYNIVYE